MYGTAKTPWIPCLPQPPSHLQPHPSLPLVLPHAYTASTHHHANVIAPPSTPPSLPSPNSSLSSTPPPQAIPYLRPPLGHSLPNPHPRPPPTRTPTIATPRHYPARIGLTQTPHPTQSLTLTPSPMTPTPATPRQPQLAPPSTARHLPTLQPTYVTPRHPRCIPT